MRSIEQHSQIPFSERVTSKRGKLHLSLQGHLLGSVERHLLDNILAGTELNYPENFGDEYLRGIDEGAWPILIGNHRAHIDGVLLGKATRVLTMAANEKLEENERMQGFALIMAASLRYGHQGPMLKSFLDEAYPIIDGHDAIPFYNVRPQDLRRYKIRPQFEQEKNDAIAAIKSGWALAVLPEGETKGGKTNKETGKAYGMIPFMKGAIPSLMNLVVEAEKIPMIIPFSISGGDKAQNANTRLPSLGLFKAGLGIGNMHMIDLNLGSPLRADQGELAELYRARDFVGLNNLIGKAVARGLPENDRGVYA